MRGTRGLTSVGSFLKIQCSSRSALQTGKTVKYLILRIRSFQGSHRQRMPSTLPTHKILILTEILVESVSKTFASPKRSFCSEWLELCKRCMIQPEHSTLLLEV